jgi:SagB-type dehydrogenase family enzyme
MSKESWQQILLPQGNQDQVWELFHENSKIGRFDSSLSDEAVLARMADMEESLPFVGYPMIDLPRTLPRLDCSVDEAMVNRVSARELVPYEISLENVAALLFYAYGVTRKKEDTGFPRSFRVVPSAGALYPLEIFFHSARIECLQPGLYHYNPIRGHIRLLRDSDDTQQIANAMVQPEIALGASLIIFITALFERSTFKYGDRGYRFAFLEAGHVVQNINLAASALGLGCVNLGGYYDREIDDFLSLDGITHSTIYMIAIGTRAPKPSIR